MTNAVISTNGVISWTPSEGQGPGIYTLTTVVSDGSLSATNSFNETVNEVNLAPVLPGQNKHHEQRADAGGGDEHGERTTTYRSLRWGIS